MMKIRQRVRDLTLATVALCLVPTVAFAAGGHGFDLKTHGLYIVDFLLVFVPLAIIVAPRLKKFLAGRYEEIKADVDEATHDFEEADAGLNRARERLDNIVAEIATMKSEFKALGEKERDSLAHEGAMLSEKIRKDADFRISQAVKMAHIELRETVIRQSLEAVEKGLAAEAGKAIPESMVNRFVREIGNDRAEA